MPQSVIVSLTSHAENALRRRSDVSESIAERPWHNFWQVPYILTPFSKTVSREFIKSPFWTYNVN